jgi:hypothetical protein
VTYQLILQWPATSIKDYDAMIEVESAVIRGLGGLGKVDGHDAGSGEMNIFILTEQPQSAFKRILEFIGSKDFMPELRAAYREVGNEAFTVLYPPQLRQFRIA